MNVPFQIRLCNYKYRFRNKQVFRLYQVQFLFHNLYRYRSCYNMCYSFCYNIYALNQRLSVNLQLTRRRILFCFPRLQDLQALECLPLPKTHARFLSGQVRYFRLYHCPYNSMYHQQVLVAIL